MQKLHPGLLGSGTEFFTDENGEIKAFNDGRVISFENLPPYLYQKVHEIMIADIQAMEILFKWYPNSDTDRLKKYISCRFGGLDFSADLDSGVSQYGEHVDCPLRAVCPGNGLVCKAAHVNGKPLTDEEISLLKLLGTPKTNECISDILGLPLGTFHKIKKNLYSKLKIQTKQEALTIAYRLGIISV